MNSADIEHINRGIQSLVGSTGSGGESNGSMFRIVNLCDPVKVYVLPKPVKRGI